MKYRLECRSGDGDWHVIGQVSTRKDANYWLGKYRTIFPRRLFRAVVELDPQMEDEVRVRVQ